MLKYVKISIEHMFKFVDLLIFIQFSPEIIKAHHPF